MYGVVEIGGHQYRAEVGEILDVQKLEVEAGKDLTFDKVLFVGGEKPLVGLPTVKGAKLTVRVIKHDRSRKLVVFKRLPGLGQFKKKNGHRQHYTSLLITALDDGNGNVTKIDKTSKRAEKFLK